MRKGKRKVRFGVQQQTDCEMNVSVSDQELLPSIWRIAGEQAITRGMEYEHAESGLKYVEHVKEDWVLSYECYCQYI